MKTCSTCKIEKPLADFYPKKGGRFGVSSICKSCNSLKCRAKYAKNAKAISVAGRAFRQENREMLTERARRRYLVHREKIRAEQKAYYERNREARATYNQRWRAENPDWLRNYEANRRDRKYLVNLAIRFKNIAKWRAYTAEYVRMRKNHLRHAQPLWAKKDAIFAMYMLAQILTEETGVPHHVDHVIPLKGKTVSGLHVETNLQILIASDNLTKSNSFDGW